MKKTSRLQSAMEYLMTYGWAILIIAVVLGALFQLGVFNSSSFSPRAPPGACQVFRPGGPGTVTNINLMGVCTGQLPQYVGVFNTQGYVTIQNDAKFLSDPMTVSLWISLNDFNSRTAVGSYTGAGNNWMLYRNNFWSTGQFGALFPYNKVGGGTTYMLPCDYILQPNKLTHIVFTRSSSGSNANSLIYADGVFQDSRTVSDFLSWMQDATQPLLIGGAPSGGRFYGLITNVQIYNTSLTANQIRALYLEGIGGAPMVLQNLVGWWPLNGDTKDYSGNNNNGVPSSITFTSQYGK